MAARLILLLVVVSVFLGILHADDANPKADAVFVGKIIKFGPIALGPPGESLMCVTKIEVVQVLQGSIESKVSVTIPAGHNEFAEPKLKIGDSAIFFVRKVSNPDPDPYVAVLIQPVTGEAIDRLKKS